MLLRTVHYLLDMKGFHPHCQVYLLTSLPRWTPATYLGFTHVDYQPTVDLLSSLGWNHKQTFSCDIFRSNPGVEAYDFFFPQISASFFYLPGFTKVSQT